MLFSTVLVSLLLTADAQPAAQTAEAKAAFDSGKSLFKQSKYQEAIVKFEEAFAIKPHALIYFNVGICHERLGHVPQALRAYRQFIRLAPTDPEVKNASTLISKLETELKAKGVQQIMVMVDPTGAQIEVDGKDIGSTPATAELTPGSHELVISAFGFETMKRTFVMPDSHSSEMTLALRKTAGVPMLNILTPKERAPDAVSVATPVEPQKKPRIFTWVAAGLAAAAGGTGAAFGSMNLDALNKLQSLDARQSDARNGRQLASDLKTNADVANGLFIGAGVSAAAAVVLFFVEGN
jgi:hypothetical protein